MTYICYHKCDKLPVIMYNFQFSTNGKYAYWPENIYNSQIRFLVTYIYNYINQVIKTNCGFNRR